MLTAQTQPMDEPTLVRSLRKLDPSRDLRVVHQPIVDTLTGRAVGAEALVRWQRSDGSLVPCEQFIPLAEQLGTIDRIGEWVLAAACHDASTWPGHAVLGVNVSACQLAQPGFAERALSIACEAGLAPHRLALEITETAPVRLVPSTRDNVDALCAAGVRLALDDFGTGHANLTSLATLPVSFVKVDQSFVTAAARPGVARAVIRHTVALANELGAQCVAEGVQTEAQRDVVVGLGCALAQGWLFAHPMDAADITEMFFAQVAVPAQREPWLG